MLCLQGDDEEDQRKECFHWRVHFKILNYINPKNKNNEIRCCWWCRTRESASIWFLNRHKSTNSRFEVEAVIRFVRIRWSCPRTSQIQFWLSISNFMVAKIIRISQFQFDKLFLSIVQTIKLYFAGAAWFFIDEVAFLNVQLTTIGDIIFFCYFVEVIVLGIGVVLEKSIYQLGLALLKIRYKVGLCFFAFLWILRGLVPRLVIRITLEKVGHQ